MPIELKIPQGGYNGITGLEIKKAIVKNFVATITASKKFSPEATTLLEREFDRGLENTNRFQNHLVYHNAKLAGTIQISFLRGEMKLFVPVNITADLGVTYYPGDPGAFKASFSRTMPPQFVENAETKERERVPLPAGEPELITITVGIDVDKRTGIPPNMLREQTGQPVPQATLKSGQIVDAEVQRQGQSGKEK